MSGPQTFDGRARLREIGEARRALPPVAGKGEVSDDHPQQTNQWLGRLPAADRHALICGARPRTLFAGDVLCEPGEWITEILLVDAGIVSSVIPLSDGRSVEAYMVGNEGLTGTEASFSPARSINRLTVQGQGSARAIEAEAFRRIVAERPAVRAGIADFQWSLKAELEQSVACNAVHASERRFAKWLLRCHDRTQGDVMLLTQEYLAAMLGTQRTTVNEVAQPLQKQGGIRYSRGKITIVDRRPLEAAACECYAAITDLRHTASLAI
ncbi:MAG: Crp/Fnr family transcriptional regulator [Brevundimonas sp.]